MHDPAGRDLTPAVVVWSGLVVAALAADVWLIRAGKAPLTSAARTRTGTFGRLLLESHFQDMLGRADPFSLIGGLACRRG